MKKKFIFISLFISLLSQTAQANKAAGVMGASTLGSRQIAITGNIGLDIAPEPLFYGIRADVGLGKRFQIGLGGSYFGFVSGAGLYLKGNVWHSADDKHFLSISVNPSFLYIDDLFFADDKTYITFIKPSLDYELRLGNEKSIGWYSRFGGLKALSATDGNDTEFIGDTGTFSLFLETGLQGRFSEHFSGHIELGQYVPISPDVDFSRFGIHGKIGFSFLF